MQKTTLLLFLSLWAVADLSAQFHTMNFPSRSPEITESQKLGITEITIHYHSPAIRGRNVWHRPDIIPQNGDPIAWRAGANMNTTMTFSTDVLVEGKPLAAGTYGFHIIPKESTYKLLFAHNSNQWGSYYLDQEKDVSLSVEVKDTVCSRSEQLDYEFLDRKENSVTIALEWGERRIPFRVEVDLNKTVVDNFRHELRGINTYRWEAWNDAANWCLRHDTNLEEALVWANRSIEGGYQGFGANKNINNLTTKAQLEKKLGKKEDLQKTIEEAMDMKCTAYETNAFNIFLLRNEYFTEAVAYSTQALEQHPDTWYIQLNKGIGHYFLKDKKAASKALSVAVEKAPDSFKERIEQISKEVADGTYKM